MLKGVVTILAFGYTAWTWIAIVRMWVRHRVLQARCREVMLEMRPIAPLLLAAAVACDLLLRSEHGWPWRALFAAGDLMWFAIVRREWPDDDDDDRWTKRRKRLQRRLTRPILRPHTSA